MNCWKCGKDAVCLIEYQGKIFKALCKHHLDLFDRKRIREINKQLKGLKKEDFIPSWEQKK